MKRTLLLILGTALALFAAGCQSEAPIADKDNRNADGEVEGKAPSFVMVPAQNDPSNPNKK
jgi:hypothetical protein